MNKLLSLRTFLPATLDYSVLSCRIRSAVVSHICQHSTLSGDGGAAPGEDGMGDGSNSNHELNPVVETPSDAVYSAVESQIGQHSTSSGESGLAPGDDGSNSNYELNPVLENRNPSGARDDSGDDGSNSNYELNPVFENRNPRNLELLGLARKQQGWKFQAPRKDFYYKVVYEKTNWNIKGAIEHSSGSTVLEATTHEPDLYKQLKSCVDVTASALIGKELGRRCLEAGMVNIFYDQQSGDQGSEKLQAFLKCLQESGVELNEIDEVVVENKYGIDYSRRNNRVGEKKKYRDDYQLD